MFAQTCCPFWYQINHRCLFQKRRERRRLFLLWFRYKIRSPLQPRSKLLEGIDRWMNVWGAGADVRNACSSSHPIWLCVGWLPDRLFHNFGASKSVSRRFRATCNPLISWWWGRRIVKGPVEYMYDLGGGVCFYIHGPLSALLNGTTCADRTFHNSTASKLTDIMYFRNLHLRISRL